MRRAMVPPPTPAPQRLAPIDTLKAAAIVAVVFTHAGPGMRWATGGEGVETFLRDVWTSFHVPAFILVSGFLYYRPRPVSLDETRRRLARILGPYLVASLAVQLLGYAEVHGPGDAAWQLLTASALGIYYYVFLITASVLLLPLVSRLPRGAVLAAAIVLFALSAPAVWTFLTRVPNALFWYSRNPFNFAFPLFLTGWAAAAYRSRLRSAGRRLRPLLWAAATAVVAGWLLFYGEWPHFTFGYDRILYTLAVAVLVALATAGRRVPPAVLFLSQASYTIYLYHHVFQLALLPAVSGWSPVARTLALVAAGLAGSAALAWLGQRLLGPRSRLVLG